MPVTASLKSLIGIVCLGLTIALSIASLAITLSTASRAIEGIAQDYVSASVAHTAALIEKHFQASVVGLQFVQNWAARQDISSPTEIRKLKMGAAHAIDRDEGTEWINILIALHRQGGRKPREHQLAVNFNDGTIYSAGYTVGLEGFILTVRGHYEHGRTGSLNISYNMYVATNTTTENPNGFYHLLETPLIWDNPPATIHERYDLPNRDMFPRPSMLHWSNLTRFVSLSLTLFGPVYNIHGEEMGFVFSDMAVDIFDGVLQAFPRPDGADILLVANDGRVMGSTRGDGAVTRLFENETAAYNGDFASDCIKEDIPTGGDFVQAYVCLKHALSYHPTLAELWQTGRLQATDDSTFTGVEGGMYVGIQPINTVSQEQAQIPNMHWKVVVMYDKDVVHAELVRGQNISIGVVIGIAAVCLGLAMAVVHVVMKPLEAVAEDMEHVATMQNLGDTTVPDVSHLEEVYSVQQSFAALKNHLMLIRSYLPHTLLVKLDRGENPDDFGGASEEDELEESLSSIASVRSDMALRSVIDMAPTSPITPMAASGTGMGASSSVMEASSHSRSSADSKCSTGKYRSQSTTNPPHQPQPHHERQNSSSTSGSASRQNSLVGARSRFRLSLTTVVPAEGTVDAPASSPLAAKAPLQRWSDIRRVNRRSSVHNEVVPPLGSTKLVTRKKATILAVNIRDFHSATGDGFAQQYELITQQLYDVVVDNGGAIVTFSGDHFIISFNAVTPVGSHCQHACKTAVALRKLFAYNDGTARSALTAGIATGAVMVGNLGCQDMKRTQVIGAAYTQATVCERLCKVYTGVNILATKAVERDACGFVEFQSVDIVNLPKARRCVISAVMDLKQAGAADEWMYQMQDSEDKSPFAAINRGFELYMAGDTEQARKLVSDTPLPLEDVNLVGRSQLRALLSDHPDEGRTYVNEMSTFFSQCMM